MGFLVKAVKSVFKAIGSILISPLFSLFKSKPKKKAAYSASVSKTIEPEAFRKIVFGNTAAPCDIRFWQVWGTNNEKYDEIVFLASHRINAILELYCENELAIDAAGTVQANYTGVLTRTTKLGLNGQSALVVGDGTQWNASSTSDGCANMALRWVPTQAKLPNGIPTIYRQRVEGALVYDPRRDSTNGGSGTHRYNDQTTWSYATLDANSVPIGRNNALQALWYLLGWYVPNTVSGELILVAGRGVDPTDINFASFITGANNCETAQYYTDMVLSTEDAHTSNEDKITGEGLIGQLIDVGGLWSYYANVDDTSSVALFITDADILEGGTVNYSEFKGIADQFQQVSGKFIDANANALWQPNGYPLIRDTTYETNTGLKRRMTQDFVQVQDVLLAQKLARLKLNEAQFQAEFSAAFMFRCMKAQAWSIVSYTSDRYGWTKKWRVTRFDITMSSGISMVLREVDASIWTAGSVTTPPAPSAGTKYDPRQQIAVAGLGLVGFSSTSTIGTIVDGAIVSWTQAPANVSYTEVQFKQNSATYWESMSALKPDQLNQFITPLLSGEVYNFRVRHISIHEVAGAWATGNLTIGQTSNVKSTNIVAAGLSSENLIINANFVLGTEYWTYYGPVTFTAAASTTDPAPVFPVFGVGTSEIFHGNILYLSGGQKVFVSAYIWRATGTGTVQQTITLYCYAANGSFITNIDVYFTPTIFDAWQYIENQVTMPSNCVYVQLRLTSVINTSGTQKTALPRLANSQLQADATITINAQTPQIYAADYLGALAEALVPYSVKVYRGGNSIKLDNNTTYVVNDSYGITGTVDNTNGSPTKGDYTPTAFTVLDGWVEITVSVNGVAQPKKRVDFTKDVALAPVSGGTGAKSANDPSLTTINSTSYAVVTDLMTVTIALGESLYCTAPINYYVNGNTVASRTATFMWQYSVAGSGSWFDFPGAALTGTAGTSGVVTGYPEPEFLEGDPGYIEVTQTKGGLGAGAYDVRLRGLLSAAGRNVDLVGTATVLAKV